jgi:hypothetical protein
LGRLDGRVSKASSVAGRLPGANFNVKQLSDNFAGVGLSLQEMVVLSGKQRTCQISLTEGKMERPCFQWICISYGEFLHSQWISVGYGDFLNSQ